MRFRLITNVNVQFTAADADVFPSKVRHYNVSLNAIMLKLDDNRHKLASHFLSGFN